MNEIINKVPTFGLCKMGDASLRTAKSILRLCSGIATQKSSRPVENLGRKVLALKLSPRFTLGLACAAALFFSDVEAQAQESNAAPVQVSRRGGFIFGVALGPQVGSVRGYPNDARRLGRREFLAETGFSAGGAGSAWVGIAFNDVLSFSLAGYGGTLVGAQHQTSYKAFAFRVEAYPVFAAGGPFRDLGVSIESGLGVVASSLRSDPATIPIDSGAASRLAVGAFYEGIRLSKLSMGPFVEADLMWSPSAFRPTAWLGWRMNFQNRP